jgi:trypsin
VALVQRPGSADNTPRTVRLPRLIVFTLAALALAAVPAAAQTRPPAPGGQIINGHAPSQAWPAQTSVVLTIGLQNFVCGGTLVSARWVLTAGHCATGNTGAPLTPGAFALRVGSNRRDAGGTVVGVDQVARQPGYTNTDPPTNDMALLHLAAAVPEEPLRLIDTSAEDASLWTPGVQATVIGWGITDPADPTSQSATLVEAQAPMVGDGACAGVWGTAFAAASMVCAGGTGTDTCGGDSGGPLMIAREGAFALVGVTSWGSDPCGATGVYARLGAPALNAWVRGNVPSVAMTRSSATAAAGEQVTLGATVGLGAHAATPAPTLTWDLDDDGAFDDATGPTATMAFATVGSHAVRAQALFADNDRAVAREVVAVPAPDAQPPAPGPGPAAQATPPAATAPPAPQATPAQIQQIQAALAPAPIGAVTVPGSLKLRTLRGTSLRVRFRCERACQISGRMTLDAATARRFGLRTGETIGRGSGSRTSGGRSTMTVRLTSRAKRALRNRGRFSVRLATHLRGDGAISVRGTKRITVSR